LPIRRGDEEEAGVARITDEYEGTPVWRLMTTFTQLQRAHRLVEAHSRLRSADLRLLWLLSDGVPRSMREIADQLALERSTVSRQVSAALADGLIARTDQPVAGARPLVVTQTGTDALTQVIEGNFGDYLGALDVLPEEERERFVENLAAVVESYGSRVAERHGHHC
jgi:DNA-binding MarR family transcriptional regulator